MLRPLAQTAHDPVSSMGDDTRDPAARRPRAAALAYLRQRFAQVTNPAIDHLRERLVMSLPTLLGAARAAPRRTADGRGSAVELRLPALPVGARGARRRACSTRPSRAERGARAALERLAALRRGGGRGGRRAALLSGRRGGRRPGADPALLALGRCTTASSSDGPADAVLAPRRERRAARDAPRRLPARLRRRRDLPAARARDRRRARRRRPASAATGPRPTRRSAGSARGSRRACSRSCPRWASRTSPAIAARSSSKPSGSTRDLVDDALAGTPSADRRRRLERFEREALERLRGVARRRRPQLENPGYVKFRKGGEPHATDPDVVDGAAGGGDGRARAAHRGERRRSLRPLRPLRRARQRPCAARAPRPARARLRPELPVPLDEVEPAECDRPPLLGGAHVARRALRGGARDDRDRAEPASAHARTRARAARTRRASATSATPGSSRSRRAASA